MDIPAPGPPQTGPQQTVSLALDARPETPKVRPLRNDLRIMPGPRDHGSPTWTINDLSANRFFNIGWQEFELLSRWHMVEAEKIIADVAANTTLRPKLEDIAQLIHFLRGNNLLIPQGAEERDLLKKAYMKKQHIGVSTLIKNYLFFKIPLWRPDRFLNAVVPHLDWLFTRKVFLFILLSALLSGVLLAQNWTAFRNTYIYFFTFEGVVISGLSIFISQLTHELGHAVVAKRQGLKVPTIGVAFLVMFPIIYTDTTDAWKLKRSDQKMAVNIAGIATDTIMAVIATLLWYVLPDGPLRSACFIMASVTWVMTLAVNLNPFMRFDGYYLLSDGLRIENMQARSFEYARWFLRRHILGLASPPPERLELWQRCFMLAYSYLTWIYRFFLFLGIALVVYHLFFKALGVLMMGIELVFFIALPIAREFAVWWKQRKDITMNRTLQTSIAIFCLAVLVLVLPWQDRIEAPALMKSGAETTLYTPVPARIEKIMVKNGDIVKKGDLLFVLNADKLDFDKRAAELDAQRHQTIISRGAVAGSWREERLVSSRNLAASEATITGIRQQKERLDIRAPFDGQIVDIDSEIHQGRWVNTQSELGRLILPSNRIIMAYVRERDFSKIHPGAEVYFESDMPEAAIRGTITSIDPTAQRYLEENILASDFKGGIAARRNEQGQYIPHEAVYGVRIAIDQNVALPLRLQRGWASIRGERTSIAMEIIRRAKALFVREVALS